MDLRFISFIPRDSELQASFTDADEPPGTMLLPVLESVFAAVDAAVPGSVFVDVVLLFEFDEA